MDGIRSGVLFLASTLVGALIGLALGHGVYTTLFSDPIFLGWVLTGSTACGSLMGAAVGAAESGRHRHPGGVA
jgi:hypothetical protein